MSLQSYSFTLQRKSRTSDGAGGKNETWTNVATGLLATQNYYRRISLDRLEQADHNAQGTGAQTQKKQLFVFRAPFPDVRTNDRLQAADGTLYNVLFVRQYEMTMQVDAETVG